MAEFKKNNRFTKSARKPFARGGRPSFRGGPRPNRDFGGEREMFDAECANCHKMTEVPFKPNGIKPVYCRDCFRPENDRGERSERSGSRFDKREVAPKRSFAPRPAETGMGMRELKEQMEAMNETLKNIVTLLENNARAQALSNEMEKYRVSETVVKAKKGSAKKSKKK